MTKKLKTDDQAKAFRKAARELGCDKSEERFQEALRALAKPRPGTPKKPPKLANK